MIIKTLWGQSKKTNSPVPSFTTFMSSAGFIGGVNGALHRGHRVQASPGDLDHKLTLSTLNMFCVL